MAPLESKVETEVSPVTSKVPPTVAFFAIATVVTWLPLPSLKPEIVSAVVELS